MNRFLTLSSAVVLLAAVSPRIAAQTHPPAKDPDPCKLVTVEQINALLGTPVKPGQQGPNDCTWRDGKGVDRVYLSLRDSKDFHALRGQMQTTGKMLPITGVAEDAFFVSSTGNSAALYALKKTHVVLLTVDGNGFSKADNEAAEKTLAIQILAKL
jgi:hypothetical protein